MPYILEVQKMDWNNKSQHLGYMNIVFESKQDAANYYNKFNQHMPQLNITNKWCSEWDPNTYKFYIVREHFYEYLHIASFENQKTNNIDSII